MTERDMLPAPRNTQEAMEIANQLARSGFVPKNFDGKPEAIFVAMMWSHAYNMPIVQGLQSLAIINNKPSLYGDAALAVVNASGKLEDIKEEVKEVDGVLTGICTVKRVNRSPTIRTFSITEADKAGLIARSPVWKAYPKRMLQMRARAFALRDAFPDVLSGIGIAEEVQDEVPIDDNAPASSEKKMPRRKVKETPKDVEDIQEVKPAEEVKQEQPPALEHSEPEVAQFDWRTACDNANTISELNQVWFNTPKELRTKEMIDYCTARKHYLTSGQGA